MKYRRPKGTNDFTGKDALLFEELNNLGASIFTSYGFEPAILPIFEHTELFARGIGSDTDIVSKEMWTFQDRKGRSLTLRPEGTASTVRAFLENGLSKSGVQKFYYSGPFFRYERPQKGRYRQFHQLGLEVIGDGSAAADVEIIDAFLTFMEKVGLEGLEVKINSVGCDKCRPSYTEALKSFLGNCFEDLCGDCKIRSEKNPLRVFDCKNADCNDIVKKAPRITDCLCDECENHHQIIKSGLDYLGHKYTSDPDLVRGLDYYTRTAFEVSCNRLGAQDAVGGGGRYDKLVKQLGGQSTPATGFAIGIERLMMLVSEQRENEGDKAARLNNAPVLFIAVDSDETRIEGLKLAGRLRRGGAIVKMDHLTNKLGKQMGRANKAAVDFVAVLGTRELETKVVNLKNLATGDQSEISFDTLFDRFFVK